MPLQSQSVIYHIFTGLGDNPTYPRFFEGMNDRLVGRLLYLFVARITLIQSWVLHQPPMSVCVITVV